jgi:DamX protein
MVDDDIFTYQGKQPPRDQTNTSVPSLISKERMQKLELLIHLTANLTQPLVLCGPEGIGKTTLLKVFQERKVKSWQYCPVLGSADLSFEAIQGQLAQAQPGKSVQSLSMASEQYQNHHKQIVLIIDNAGELVPGLITAIIRYAAANPVLRVIFALTHDELQIKRGSDRVVEDCHIVEIPPLSEKQCGNFLQYLLTKPTVNVSFKASAPAHAPYLHPVGKAISENMIARIYRRTHGVPGRIITELSDLSGAKQGGKLKWMLALAVTGVCAIAFGVQWLASSKNNDKAVIAPASVEQKADGIEIAPPQPEPQIMLTLPPAQPVIHQLWAQQEEPKQSELNKTVNDVEPPSPENLEIKAQSEPVSSVGVDQKPDNKQSDVAQEKIAGPLRASREKPKQAELSKTVNNVEPFTPNNPEIIRIPQKPVEVAVIPEKQVMETAAPQPQQVEPGRIGSLPIATLLTCMDGGNAEDCREQSRPPSLAVEGSLAPSANNFTLQLIVLSKQSSVNDILKKYPAMEPDFRVIKTVAKGREKFILFYGSYPDNASAKKARQSLPSEFRNALVRKMSSIEHR